jgi:carnitine O-palmitoyltransferase 2
LQVCLDASSPNDVVSDTRTALHGSGRDRWFDKSFQLVVAANGRSTVNFEHAWGDGAAVLRYFDEVFTCANSLPVLPPPGTPAALPGARVERVDFDIDGRTTTAIGAAASRFDTHCAEVEFCPLETDAISGNAMKKHGVGGDGVMQMAFQLAHFRMCVKKTTTPTTHHPPRSLLCRFVFICTEFTFTA